MNEIYINLADEGFVVKEGEEVIYYMLRDSDVLWDKLLNEELENS